MPVTEIQLLRIYENLFGTTLMWLIPFSHLFPFPSPCLSHAFILLPKRHKIGIILNLLP